METYGNCGRSGRDYTGAESVLAGRLASELDAVYPEDRCPACELLGRLTADEKCFHRHWKKVSE